MMASQIITRQTLLSFYGITNSTCTYALYRLHPHRHLHTQDPGLHTPALTCASCTPDKQQDELPCSSRCCMNLTMNKIVTLPTPLLDPDLTPSHTAEDNELCHHGPIIVTLPLSQQFLQLKLVPQHCYSISISTPSCFTALSHTPAHQTRPRARARTPQARTITLTH